jgi:signal transduction histidine kinase
MLEIGDTGKGISKDVEAKLFTPFFSTKPNGQGIGLIFIREVLMKHGLTFSLRTYPDGITRFRICF